MPLIIRVSFILDEICLVIGPGKEYPLFCFLHSRPSSFLALGVTPDTGAECGNSIALSALAAVPPLYKFRGLGGITLRLQEMGLEDPVSSGVVGRSAYAHGIREVSAMSYLVHGAVASL